MMQDSVQRELTERFAASMTDLTERTLRKLAEEPKLASLRVEHLRALNLLHHSGARTAEQIAANLGCRTETALDIAKDLERQELIQRGTTGDGADMAAWQVSDTGSETMTGVSGTRELVRGANMDPQLLESTTNHMERLVQDLKNADAQPARENP